MSGNDHDSVRYAYQEREGKLCAVLTIQECELGKLAEYFWPIVLRGEINCLVHARLIAIVHGTLVLVQDGQSLDSD